MADLQPGGTKMPDEKSGKKGMEKPGQKPAVEGNGGDASSKTEKNAIHRRRRLQRKKFLGDLQNNKDTRPPHEKRQPKLQPQGVKPETVQERKERPSKPLEKEMQRPWPPEKKEETQPQPFKREERHKEPVQEEVSPQVPPQIEETEKPGLTEPSSERSMRVREELHPRAQKLERGEIRQAEPAEEVVVGEEEPAAVEPSAEPAHQRTYFAHPFGEEEKPETPVSEEEEMQPLPVGEEEQQEPPFIEEETKYVAQPAQEDEIMIGVPEEKAPPMPVGRLREAEKEEKPEERKAVPPEEQKLTDIDKEKRNEGKAETEEAPTVTEAEKHEKELLTEKKALDYRVQEWFSERLKWITAVAPSMLKGIKAFFGKAGSVIKPKVIVLFLLLALAGGGGYWVYVQGWPQKIGAYITDFLKPKPVEKVEVKVNPEDQRKFGLVTAAIFAANMGSVNDRLPLQINMADYFGNRKEPAVKGETGISAATFYGQLKDDAGQVNQFVAYVKQLEVMQNLYKTDVYGMLDRSAERDKVLLDYLAKLKKTRETGQELLARIRINLDDFNLSYQSLNPDRTKYEKDFFTAMEGLQPEKSDLLLKGFIDISQKQSALKARINALNKLASYYETALKRLDTRILAIEQNKDALIQGIRVVDIPGANLDIIIRPATTTTTTTSGK